ncbi:MAG: GNAT family N-acetyltransferase [Kouleothrix sp.]|nr:GNAT family N-acetyltransferase [Kouleothrix sp.]
MSQIRQLAAEADFDAFARIGANAYPGTRVVSEEDRQRLKQRLFARADDPLVAFYGLFEGEQLRGAMRLHDFTINVRGVKIPAGGVGFVAVDLLHKKEGVAKELVQFFLRRCRERGQHLALLYPFRPDFYRKMGFGYGAKMSQYRVRPADLPGGGARRQVQMLSAADKQLVSECYARLAAARRGLIDKSPLELDSLFAPPENRVVGYQSGDALAGYMVFSFVPGGQDTFLINDILVKELVYESPTALAGILAFLRSQADQIRQVVFNLQDDDFHHLLHDPRDGSDHFMASLYQQTNRQGLGIMYRVVDTRAARRPVRCQLRRAGLPAQDHRARQLPARQPRRPAGPLRGRAARAARRRRARGRDPARRGRSVGAADGRGRLQVAAPLRRGHDLGGGRSRAGRPAVPRRRAAGVHDLVLASDKETRRQGDKRGV